MNRDPRVPRLAALLLCLCASGCTSEGGTRYELFSGGPRTATEWIIAGCSVLLVVILVIIRAGK